MLSTVDSTIQLTSYIKQILRQCALLKSPMIMLEKLSNDADGGQTPRYMKYLQADCYGENGQLITTKFSTNYNSQFNGDNNETGFQF